METIKYNKLIRDRIPEIIEEAGKEVKFESVKDEQLFKFLNCKLEEELDEYLESDNVEELADLVEVIHGILLHKGISLEAFEDIRLKKKEARGGFEKGLVLKEVKD